MPHVPYLTGDKAAIEAFIDRFDTFLFDCDGVIWSGSQNFPKIPETIDMLREKGKKLVFVTNNSTKSRSDNKKKFDKAGINTHEDEIFGSSYSAAIYISRIMKLEPPHNKVFVLGETGVEQELAAEGIPYIGGTDPAMQREITDADYKAISDGSALDPDVAVVLTALDFHPSYLKYALGHAYIRQGAHFLATNTDQTLPSHGALFPGAGSISSVLVKASGQEPLALGKPSQAMMDAVEGKFKFDRKKACMVGDRLNTDIQFGIQGGLGGTLAVLSGVVKKEEFLAEDAQVFPTAYVNRLSDLLG